ncbi:hypothetical protein QTP88_023028 [Uroleucon formosanum]
MNSPAIKLLDQVKQQDRTADTPRKSFRSYTFIIIVVVSLLAGYFFRLFNEFDNLYNYSNSHGLSEDKLKSTMMSLKNHFPLLQKGMIKKLGGALARLQTPGEPIVFMLLHNDDNKQTTDCIASYASASAKQYIFTKSNYGLWMNGSEWAGYSDLIHEDLLYKKLNAQLEENEVLVLENLQDLPWSLAKLLHHLCDSENPKYARAMYMLELRVNSDLQQLSDSDKLVAAERAMNIAWQDAPNEYREPLIARLTSFVDAVQWESDEPCPGESFIRISP